MASERMQIIDLVRIAVLPSLTQFATAPRTCRRAHEKNATYRFVLRVDRTSPNVSRSVIRNVSCVWAIKVSTIHVLTCNDVVILTKKQKALIPTVRGAVGDNSTQTPNIDSTTTMSRKLDTMMEERILQTVTFQATV